MAKRGYKLQEFVAHSSNVNCLSIGKKACRLFITGGDDHKVHLWAIGNPTSLMSLCGHTSPVESLAFDTAEVLVLAGASTGAIKLWDLEESKMVRTLTGHRTNCTAVQFHPFGEFFASGSMDTNLKIWDIRKKGCIHTYEGHTQGISTIRFTPDGRWVVSGGYDNVVKIWDLTAGKLLHDFTFHDRPIRSIDFHPLEFLLATGSADKTVKFWDLETFELIGSARPEATGVCTIIFHPDGRTLFCGLEDSLKVYSWEPIICHDAVDIGWSTLGDLCISDGKLLGCSYYRNSVGVWVADISLIEPYGARVLPEESDRIDNKFKISGAHPSDKVGSGMRSALGLRSRSPDNESKEIKNIYVDSIGPNNLASNRVGSLSPPKVITPSDSKEMSSPYSEKQNLTTGGNVKYGAQALNKSFVVPTVVPRDSSIEKKSSDSGKEAVNFSRTKPGMLLRPAHVRRPSNSKNELEKTSIDLEPGGYTNVVSEKESIIDASLQSRKRVPQDEAQQPCEDKSSDITSVAEKFEKILSTEAPPNQAKSEEESINANKETPPVKIINGVAVVSGRTRSLVERFERRERSGSEATNTTPSVPVTNRTAGIGTNTNACVTPETTPVMAPNMIRGVEMDRTPIAPSSITPSSEMVSDGTPTTPSMTPHIVPEMDRRTIMESNMIPRTTTEMDKTPIVASNSIILETAGTPTTGSNATHMVPETDASSVATNTTPYYISQSNRKPSVPVNITPRVTRTSRKSNITITVASPVIRETDKLSSGPTPVTPSTRHETERLSPMLRDEPQTSGRDFRPFSYKDVTEELMQTHDVFLSSLKSRLTKLQVVRHFWDRNDTKGATGAMRKLPDHSVQADVISVLIDKNEVFTLDLFSSLLPVLVGLLDSKMDRHAELSLHMLLKLVAVFGPVIHSTISAPPSVGVDLHMEERREWCNQCHLHLQKIRQILPQLLRKGGVIARCAHELNLVLMES